MHESNNGPEEGPRKSGIKRIKKTVETRVRSGMWTVFMAVSTLSVFGISLLSLNNQMLDFVVAELGVALVFLGAPWAVAIGLALAAVPVVRNGIRIHGRGR
ncbi:hypothetical protein [Nocardiopsis sp. NPDC055824]